MAGDQLLQTIMKKNYWSLFVCLAMLLSMFILTSCDKEEPELPSNKKEKKDPSSTLIGTWKMVRNQGYEIYNGKKEEWDYAENEFDFVEKIVIKKDGTGSWISEEREGFEYEEDEGDVEEFDYKLKGNMLTLDYGSGDFDSFKVTKLTSSELVIEYLLKKEDGNEFCEKFYFKKVKK